MGFSGCGSWALECGSVVWTTGSVTQQPVESSWTRDQTRVPSLGWQSLIHCATGEVLNLSFIELMKDRGHTLFTKQQHGN